MQKKDLMGECVVVDMETTGFNKTEDRILRLDAVRLADDRIEDKFSEYIRQERKISPAVTKLTGIDNSITDSARDEEAVIMDFLEFANDSPVISFMPEFDMGFLKEACLRYDVSFDNPGIDLRDICRRLIPGLKRYTSESVARELGLKIGEDESKTAVMTYADIYMKIRDKVKDLDI